MLDSVPWKMEQNQYFYDLPVLSPDYSLPTKTMYLNLAEKWINCDDDANDLTSADILSFCDIWKMFFLDCLHVSSTTLSIEKIRNMSTIYQFNDEC